MSSSFRPQASGIWCRSGSNIEKNESVDVVRQLNGVIFRENAAKGLVITTAKNYTPDAQQETQVQSDTGAWQSIDLYGFEDIVKWLELPDVVPYQPWQPFIEKVELTKPIFYPKGTVPF